MGLRKLQNYKLVHRYRDTSMYGRSTFLQYKGKETELSCGLDDDLDIYFEGDMIYVLSRNASMGYLGLEQFSRNGLDDFGQFFCQNADELELERDPFDYAPFTIIKVLAEYIY